MNNQLDNEVNDPLELLWDMYYYIFYSRERIERDTLDTIYEIIRKHVLGSQVEAANKYFDLRKDAI
jgi:hypothetical protein